MNHNTFWGFLTAFRESLKFTWWLSKHPELCPVVMPQSQGEAVGTKATNGACEGRWRDLRSDQTDERAFQG